MPALDQCHPQVVHALEREGWRVEPAPARLSTDARTVFVDIFAQRGTNGSTSPILLAEVKCFSRAGDTTTDLYIAIGQYIVYKSVLLELERNIPLYLAVPSHLYAELFDSTLQTQLRQFQFKFVLIDLQAERVERWIE